jgi:tRNA A-37 threonylcarbamoyl transferase component Bud32
MTAYNLENPADVIQFLADTPYASDNIARLSGGYTNYVYRLHLRNAYEGEKTLVLKYSKSFSMGETLIDAKRQILEVNALNFTHEWFSNSVVRTPKVHFFDEQAHAIVMSDCGDGLPTLKQYVRENPLSEELAHEVGAALGKFAAELHTHRDEKILAVLEEDPFPRNIAAWATHGRVRDTLTGKDAELKALPGGLIPPPAEDIEAASANAEDLAAAIRAPNHQAITHGDFWPGNVLVDVHDGHLRKLHLVDWELSRPGLPSIELGQMCAELYLLARFVDGREKAMGEMVSSLWDAYAGVSGDLSEEFRRQLLQHAGAHFVCWPPRTLPAWGTEDEIRELVIEGVMLLSGRSAGTHWLERCMPNI